MKSKFSSHIDMENVSLEHDPDYKAAKDKLTELQLDLVHTETRISELLNEINSQANEEGRDTRDRLGELARERIAGHKLSPTSRADLWQPFGHLKADQRVLIKAIELQKQAVARLRDRAAKPIQEALTPHHHELVRQIAVAAVGGARASDAEWQFRETLRDKDIPVDSLFTAMPIPALGSMRDEWSRVNWYLRECVERGFLSQDEADHLVDTGTL